LAEKKEGFFGRLFGGGCGCGCCEVKIEEVSEEESVSKETAPEEKKEK
jgi:ferredoxin